LQDMQDKTCDLIYRCGNKMKTFLAFLMALFIILTFMDEKTEAKFISETKIMMDTTVSITIDGSYQDIQKAFSAIEKINFLMNDYIPSTEINVLNRKGTNKLSCDTRQVILKAIYFSKITRGAFDITVGPLVRLWQRMGREKRLPTSNELNRALSLVGYKNIKISGDTVKLLKKGMMLDLGGIAKGYAVDKAIEVLRERGVKNALVNAGGDMYCLGEGPGGKWRIGIQHPRNLRKIVGIISVANRGVATSGDYHRYYVINGKRFGHIINPATGWTVQDTPMSVTIIAPNATTADALATGVFVLGPVKGLELINSLPKVEGVIISKGMKIVTSSGWGKYEVKRF